LVSNIEFIEVWEVTIKRFIIQFVFFYKKEMQSLKEHNACVI